MSKTMAGPPTKKIRAALKDGLYTSKSKDEGLIG